MDKTVVKKPNIILYTLLMLFVFIFITEGIIYGYGGGFIHHVITNYPKGSLVVGEAILSVMVIIVLLLFKNSYVFTEKKESLKTGLFYGLFFIIASILFLLLFGSSGFAGGLAIINILLGCLLIGICEEFLCRGWLLNEFLERYGDTKRGIWYSIIISGLIFGLMHIANIFTAGQDVVSTIIQVINATGLGIFFGVIYYKTKNIWSVIILHGLWDFSLLLTEIAPITEMTETITGFSIIGILFSILMVGMQLVNIIPYFKDIDAKPKKSFVIILSIVSVFFYFVFTLINGVFSIKFGETYKYENISLEHYAVTRDNYDEYTIKHNEIITNKEIDVNGIETEHIVNNEYMFKLTVNDKNNLLLTNTNTNFYIEIECEDLHDYIIVEDTNHYILAYVDYNDSSNAFLNYVYIEKSKMSNDNKYLNTLKNSIKKYLLPERAELLVINDYDNNKTYLAAFDVDYGYYLLTNENEISVLNR